MDRHRLGAKGMAEFIVVAAIFGALASVAMNSLIPKSQNDLIREFYSTETAVSVSPSDYVDHLRQGKPDGLLVDLRTAGEYAAGHLVTAVNVTAVGMDEQQLIAAFSSLPQGRPVITYCYSEYCMLSRNAGKALADNGIYVRHFTAGWYEINRDFPAYIAIGTEPGALSANQTLPANACTPGGSGQFGC
ncbi:Rhodanese-like domain protein [uncultured archaeon]|nr:Rhodanese-like domain protein [uncultured archaeon]